MPKRYYKQPTFAEKAVIYNNIKKVVKRRSSMRSEQITLPQTISLIIHADKHIDTYTTYPHMSSYGFESKNKFYESCAIASLFIINFNLMFIRQPNKLHETPESFVVSNNLNFPRNLGTVAGLTRNQSLIKLDYENFSNTIVSLLENNKKYLNDKYEECLFKYLPTDKLKLRARKLYIKLCDTLHLINSNPDYLQMLYESVYVMKTTKENLKKENLCQ